MATIKYLISKRGGDRPEVIIRLKVNQSQRVQAKVNGIFVYRAYWSEKKQKEDTSRMYVKPWEEKEMDANNIKLANLKETIIQRCKIVAEEDITGEWLKEQIDQILHPSKYEPKTAKPITLMEAVQSFLDNPENRLTQDGNPVKKSTQREYNQVKNHLTAYLGSLGKDDIETDELDSVFHSKFVHFLYGTQGLKKNTVGKMIRCLKTIINNAVPRAQRVNCEFVDSNKCKAFAEEVDNIYLTEEELQKIATVEIKTPYLDRVRDQFLLLAWTGCRYSDLGKLTGKPITEEGFSCYKLTQQKTGNEVTIPILPETDRILRKYNYNMPKPMANQKFNEYIKDVAKMAKLDDKVTIKHTEQDNNGEVCAVKRTYRKWEVVTAHTARRSFASNMYNRDFNTMMIMAITGHKTEKAFLTYIKVKPEEHAKKMFKQFMEQERRRREEESSENQQ
ncbi:MAG: site-specific integrase [Muribaculaceae bacterium]|nr:site-specific integrase [Muribaculaceae bacterium]